MQELASISIFLAHLQSVVSALLSSLAQLSDLFILTSFFLAIFGTVTVQLFAGQLRGRCGHPDFSGAYTNDQGLVLVRLVAGADTLLWCKVV